MHSHFVQPLGWSRLASHDRHVEPIAGSRMRADTEGPKKLYEVRPASNRGQTIRAIVNLGSPTVWPQFLFVRGSMWDPYLPETIAVEAKSRNPPAGYPEAHSHTASSNFPHRLTKQEAISFPDPEDYAVCPIHARGFRHRSALSLVSIPSRLGFLSLHSFRTLEATATTPRDTI